MMLKVINELTKKQEMAIVNGIATGARNVHFATLGFAITPSSTVARKC